MWSDLFFFFFQFNLPQSYRTNYVLTATHLINQIPLPLLNNHIPYELLFHKQPVYTHLRAFSCLCFVNKIKNNQIKFHPRAFKCIFIGYLPNTKGYKVLDLLTLQFFIPRNVIFHESIFSSIPNITHTPFLFPNFPKKFDPISTTISLSLPISITSSTNPHNTNLRRSKKVIHTPYYCGNLTKNSSVSSSFFSCCFPSLGKPYSIIPIFLCLNYLPNIKPLFQPSPLILNPKLLNKLYSILIGNLL